MSYAPSQPSSNNGMLVLITLGVCALSCLELVAVIFGYFLFVGGVFASRVAALQRMEQQRIAQAPPSHFPQPVPSRSPSTPRTMPSPATSGPGSAYASISQVKVNDRVHILWGASWYPGTVIQRNGAQAKIHYDNHTDSWDEFVGVDRLRRMSMDDRQYFANQPKPSTPPLVTPPTNPARSTRTPADLNPRRLSAPFDSSQPSQDHSNRDWKSRSGEVIFHGQLYGNYGEVVCLLERTFNTVRTLPVDVSLLSDEDQAYVRRFPVKSPNPSGFPPLPRDPYAARKEMERRQKELNRPTKDQETQPPPTSPATTTPAASDDSLHKMRTWSDSTGRFKLDAELLAVQNGSVQLKRPDGKVTTMPIDKLSAEDRALVRAKYPE